MSQGHFPAVELAPFVVGMEIGQALTVLRVSDVMLRRLVRIVDAVALFHVLVIQSPFRHEWLLVALAGLPMLIVALVLEQRTSWIARLLRFRPLLFLAPYSLSIYLTHVPVIWWYRHLRRSVTVSFEQTCFLGESWSYTESKVRYTDIFVMTEVAYLAGMLADHVKRSLVDVYLPPMLGGIQHDVEN